MHLWTESWRPNFDLRHAFPTELKRHYGFLFVGNNEFMKLIEISGMGQCDAVPIIIKLSRKSVHLDHSLLDAHSIE